MRAAAKSCLALWLACVAISAYAYPPSSAALVLPSQGFLTAVVLDGSLPSLQKQSAQEVDLAAGSSAQLNFVTVTANGRPVDLTGSAVVLTVKRSPSDPPLISREASVGAPTSGAGYFPLGIADTLTMRGAYAYDVSITWPDGSHSQVVPMSTWSVQTALSVPGQAVTVPAAQQPLAIGQRGLQGFPSLVQHLSVLLPTRGTLHSDGTVVLSDDSGNLWTNLGLPALGPGAGVQTLATGETLTFDAQARTVAISPVTRSLMAGVGLTGGGTLALDRSFAVDQSSAFNPTWLGAHTFGGQVKIGAGLRNNNATITGNATLAASNLDTWVNCSAACTITLPSSPASGETHHIQDTSGLAAVNTITITATPNTIDGATTKTITQNYGRYALEWDGAQWRTKIRNSYGQVQANGTAQPERRVVNFDSTMAVSDTAASDRTNIGLPSVATPGTYGNNQDAFVGAAILDAYGRTQAYSTHAADWANVKDFGAKGDGTTNDTAAIQAAVDHLRDTGGVVWFPPSSGCYGIRNPGIQILATASHSYSNIVLKGGGYSSCIKALETIGTNNGVGNLAAVWFQGQGGHQFSLPGGVDGLRISGYDTTTLAGPLVLFVRSMTGFVVNSWIDTNSTEGIYHSSPDSDYGGIEINNHCTNVGGYGVSPANGPLSCYNNNTNNAVIAYNYANDVGQAVEAVGSGIIVNGNFFTNIAYGAALNHGVALNLESTFPGTGYVVTNNLIQYAGIGVEFSSITSIQGVHLIGSNVFENVDNGVSITNSATVSIQGNTFYDTWSSGVGSGDVIYQSSSSTGPLAVKSNMFIGGPTGTWADITDIRQANNLDVIKDNIVDFTGNVGVNACVFATNSGSSGWLLEEYDNTLWRGALSSTFPIYQWQGAGLAKNVYAGIDRGITLSTLRPSWLRAAAAPTTFPCTVGDIVDNTSKTVDGIDHWICETAGTSGWQAVYAPRGVSVTVNTSGPLGGGGPVTLGGSALTLTCSSCVTQAYQTVEQAASALAQRSVLNFTAAFAAADNAGSTRTDVDLATVATAGTYCGAGSYVASATYDKYGRINSVTCGTPTGAGTMTQLICNNGLTGGTITGSGTCAVDDAYANNYTVAQQGPPWLSNVGTGTATAQAGGTLFSSAAVVGSSTSGPVTAISYTLPANSLSANGQRVEIGFLVNHAANTNSATVQLQWGGSSLLGKTSTTSGDTFTPLKLEVKRISSTTIRVMAYGMNAANATTIGQQTVGGQNFASPITIALVLGGASISVGATANNDIVSESMSVDWLPAP